jgi:hypothetical protein
LRATTRIVDVDTERSLSVVKDVPGIGGAHRRWMDR